ncbi:hypothetical protein CHARACLAT_033545 [Characodon lateralis]|uniref:Uncharacterized protein n=1 Tax=Characodon lateralis TaxID=208331 RepID=A0ABU7EIY5_9TELE|nr:hypothetical protein [Characodon lateralis]
MLPNNKLRITSDLKDMISKNKRAFREGDGQLLRSLQKEDRTDGYLDRTNEIYTFFNRLSSETSSASSSPAHSQKDIPPSFDPQLFCHTSNVLSSTSAMDPSASTGLTLTKSEDADAPFASPSCLFVWSQSQSPKGLSGAALCDSAASGSA